MGQYGEPNSPPSERLFWFKGELLPADQCRVHAMSPTAQFGLNVFEGLRGYYNDKREELFVFRLDDHLQRLKNSAHLIGLSLPYSFGEIRSAIRSTISANRYAADVAIRLILFLDGEGSWSSEGRSDMLVAPILKPRNGIDNQRGLKATVSSWQRIGDLSMPPRIKAGANYINGRYAYLDAARKGFDVPLLLGSDGKLAESAGACVFIVRNGVLITPDLTGSILESITRDTLLHLARQLGYSTEERAIDRTELLLADEAFLCGSAAEVSAITSVDHCPVGAGKIGSLTTRLSNVYLDCASGVIDTPPGWIWPALNGG